MNRINRALIAVTALSFFLGAVSASKADEEGAIGSAVFNKQGALELPVGFRQWVFIGAPLTPNGLNKGAAGFPEFHHVYVNPDAFEVYQRTGVFPEGTVVAKELVLLKPGQYKDGSLDAPSGRGFFAGQYHGMDVMVKDSRRFSETNGWGFFNFGHQAPPYSKTARAAPAANCAACHAANAEKDMMFTQYYPILQ